MAQKLYFSCLQKIGLWYHLIQKIVAPLHVLKKYLKMETPTAHTVHANYFCNTLVSYSPTATVTSRFLIYLKLFYADVLFLYFCYFCRQFNLRFLCSKQRCFDADMTLAWHYNVASMPCRNIYRICLSGI